ncbi:MAG: sensor histidine kinase [Candidatus Binatia bacterium]
MDRLNIFHKFLLILSVTTVLAVITLASTISYLLKMSMLENEVGNTASLIKTLIGADLAPEKFAQAVGEKDGAAFARFADRLTSLPEVIRIKIYDAVGTLVWSDEKQLIGKAFLENRELGQALRGEVQVAMGLLKSEHIYERGQYNEKRLLEVYVPLQRQDTGEVYGVFEIYKYPSSHFASMDSIRRAVWAISIALGLLICASCSGLFWNALKREQRLGREKAQVQAQLIQAEKLATVGEMLAGLAHEINNPLGIMMGKVRLILKDLRGTNSKTEMVRDLLVIDRNISRMAGIVRSLLAFSRKSTSDSIALNLNTVVTESLALVERPFAKRNIFFEKALESRLPEILGDVNQLQQVFLNLWSNAQDAMPSGGKILVRTFTLNHGRAWVAAEVRDSGQGIPSDVVEKIFDPFFTTKAARERAGLGLAVSYGIVKSHGGTIQVESQPGQGATFTLKFPARV